MPVLSWMDDAPTRYSFAAEAAASADLSFTSSWRRCCWGNRRISSGYRLIGRRTRTIPCDQNMCVHLVFPQDRKYNVACDTASAFSVVRVLFSVPWPKNMSVDLHRQRPPTMESMHSEMDFKMPTARPKELTSQRAVLVDLFTVRPE